MQKQIDYLGRHLIGGQAFTTNISKNYTPMAYISKPYWNAMEFVELPIFTRRIQGIGSISCSSIPKQSDPT